MFENPKNGFVRKLLNSFVSLLYPPLCMHCDALLQSQTKVFCTACFSSMRRIILEERCPICVSCDYDFEKGLCGICALKPAAFTRAISVFDLEGPAATLFNKLSSSEGSFLTQGAAALMALQLIESKHPFPDLIIPVPQTFLRKVYYGYNPSVHLARHLSTLLNLPLLKAIKYQALSFKINDENERMAASAHLQILNSASIENKTVLLVGELMSSQGKMQECAEVLREGYPKHIYGITLCRSI